MLLRRAERRGTQAPPLRLLALRGEESAWFGTCYIGSKLLTGRLGRQELSLPHVGGGRPLDQIEQARPLDDLSRYRAYLELHNEQGPLLVETARPTAVVGGIRGSIRFPRIRCLGEAGHSGAFPNHLRHDPTVAVSHLIVALQEAVRQENEAGHDMVTITGVLHAEPAANAVARIASEVTFSLDIRSDDAAVLARRCDWLKAELAMITDRLGVKFYTGAMVSVASAACDPGLVRQLLAEQRRCGLGEARPLPSGGGHDAATFAAAGVPAAMVFVRNRNGSQNPHESMEIADLIRGVDLLDLTLLT
jgi:N-carbamoyl-L-amino-acid hydrolase